MEKRTLIFVLPLGIVLILTMVILVWTPSSSQNDIVENGDIKIHLSNIKKQKNNTFSMTMEIMNKSPLNLEENEIHIQRKKYNQPSPGNSNFVSAETPPMSDHIVSSYIEHRDSKQHLDYKHPVDVQIDNTKGSILKIPAKDSVKMDITFGFRESDNKPLVIVFTSNQISDDSNMIKPFYTTIVKEMNEE